VGGHSNKYPSCTKPRPLAAIQKTFLQMDNSQWFSLSTGQFGYPQPEDNFGYLTQTYDMSNACPTCHIGLKQANEFRFRSEPKAKNSYFIGLNWVFDQIFVRPPVEEVFTNEGVTGIIFSTPVINKTGKSMETIKQLHVDTLITDALPLDSYEYEMCEYPKEKSAIKFLSAMKSPLLIGPFCGQKKYHYLPYGKFIAKASSLNNMPDFIRISNWFGSGGNATQPIFVSYKVYEIIKRYKWRGAFLEPIDFI